MKIRDVKIKNFRTLKDTSISFDDITTFIGPNGTGKSTVLRALNWFFNGSRNGDLTNEDCSFGAVNEDIEVQVTFDNLTPADRTTLGAYVPQGVNTFTAWKRRIPGGNEYLSANAKGFGKFTEIKAAMKARDKKEVYGALRTAHPELNLPSASTAPAIDAALRKWEASNTGQLADVPEVLQTDFFGFNSGGKMSGLFDFVLITADMRGSEESQDVKASAIGKILERFINRAIADEKIGKIVEKSRVSQQKTYDKMFGKPLSAMTAKLNEVVTSYSPGRSVLITPANVELKAPRTTFDVSVVDGSTKTAVEHQGHGFQRTLLISTLQLLAQFGAAQGGGVICLAIEEPELFQHPIQALTFAKVLRSLAEDETKRMQVCYATHSPYFVDAQNFAQVRRLTRSIGEPPVVTVHSSSLQKVKEMLKTIVLPEEVARQLDGTISNQLSVALFATRALLVEGTTDAAVIYGIGDREAVGFFERQGTSIVAVGGKGSLPLAHAILTSLGIATYSLFDGDQGFAQRAETAKRSKDKIDAERCTHITLNRKLLKYFGLPEVDFPEEQVNDTVAVFSDNIEELLRSKWPEWMVTWEELETEAGMPLGKNQAAYRRVTRLSEGSIPQVLSDVITKVEVVE